jgi:drug/metabolite transporter (DMT)-like permease
MVLAMGAFSLEDMFVKAAARTIPIGEILLLFGFGGMLTFMLLTLQCKEKILHPAILTRPILIRAICEVTGRLSYALAITLTPLSSASAILQATPLVVVMGAAVFFGEKVGWRRWASILIGLIGVLMVIRPGLDGFQPASLFAVIGTLGFAARDLATRGAPAVLSHMQLGIYGFFVLIPTGIVMLIQSGGAVWVDPVSGAQILAATAIGVAAYYALTVAMRTGEVSVVTPFRYTRLVFALIVGAMVFAERPDFLTLLGSTIIVAGGVYTLLRSRKKASLQPA